MVTGAAEDGTLRQKLSELDSRSKARKAKQRTYIALSRGEDPRDVWHSSKFDDSKGVPGPNHRVTPLRTNDPQTFMDFAIHILSGNPVRWQLPVMVGIDDDEHAKNGRAERLVSAIISMNSERLWSSGRPRFERGVVDSALRMGMVVVYREAVANPSGGTDYILEPWDPLTVSELPDRYGYKQVMREIPVDIDDLIVEASRTEGWNTEVLTKLKRADKSRKTIVIQEFYERDITSDGTIVRSAVVIKDGQAIKTLGEIDEDEIPIFIHKFNGETFPGEKLENEVRSVLANNENIYIQDHDLLGQLDLHARKSLADKLQEFTSGGRAVANPAKIANPNSMTITHYDTVRGERGLDLVPINPLDPAMQIRGIRLEEMIQKGGLSKLIQGLVNTNLSGFAIQQILDAELATVQEVQNVLEYMYGRIGKWILDTFRDSDTGGKLRTVGFQPNVVKNSDWIMEEIGRSDIPKFTAIRGQIDLAQPSDLLERISMLRTAMPGAAAIFTRKTGYERIMPDIIPDAQAEVEAVEEEEVLATEAMKIVRAAGKVKQLSLEIRAGRQPDVLPELADWYDTVAEQMLQSVGVQTQGAQGRVPGGEAVPDPRALSTAARGQGVGGSPPGGMMSAPMPTANGAGPV